MIEKMLWNILMWLWCRKARRDYDGPGRCGEVFNTACFQYRVKATTGESVGGQAAAGWLATYGMANGLGGCHWFDDREKADCTFAESTKV